ncbi:hypothetical protein MGN70_013349 [Eutypa lata]|nr:hypothetical protein MGN70_013349 [Eutypa lata]
MDTSLSFDDLIAKETASDVDGITSVALLAVARSGQQLIYKTAGRRSTVSDDNVDENSLWWIYSITKTLTAISALQCVQRGQITLDDEDKVYDLVPELKTLSVLDMGDDSKMSFAPPTQKITLRRLLSHTSGINMDLFDPRLHAWRMERGETCRALYGKQAGK